MNEKEIPPRESGALTLLLGTLVGLSALGTDLYVPALPQLARDFGAPASAVQLTVTTYFLGIAAGQLIWGPLSDRYGSYAICMPMSGQRTCSPA